MEKVNIYLKRSYIGMISLIGVIGLLLLGFTLLCLGLAHYDVTDPMIRGVVFVLIFSTVILLLAIIGGFGVWKGKKWALIVFAVGGILICLYLLISNVLALVILHQVKNTLRNGYLDLLPLANASESEIADLMYEQEEFQCCGLKNYTDWENIIPYTCLCDENSTSPCIDVAASQKDGYWYRGSLKGQTIRIYSKPCLPIMNVSDFQVPKILVGISSGFIILWFLSVVLCITILCQMNKKMETLKVVFSPETNAGNDCILTEDSNPET